MSSFWNIWVWALVVITVGLCLWLLQNFTKQPAGQSTKGESTTGHSWDGDLQEFNNPLPRWWLYLFWITAVFMAVYLVLFPGLGNFRGLNGWSEKGQYESEVATAEKRYGNVYAAFAGVQLADLAKSADAVRLGRNLFLNRCAVCHGSDARGARSFPNLTDKAWLYGGAGKHFPRTVLTVLRDRGSIEVVNDEFGSPTFAGDLAWALLHLANRRGGGVFHLINEGRASRFDLAAATAVAAGLDPSSVKPIDTPGFLAKYPLPARRPADSTLLNGRASELGITLRGWRDAVREYVPSLAAEILNRPETR